MLFLFQMSVLTSRKSSSTPSLNEVNDNKPSVAATEQAASADNLTRTVKSVSISEVNLRNLASYFLLSQSVTSSTILNLTKTRKEGSCLTSDGWKKI